MMLSLQRQYGFLLQLWREGLREEVKRAAIAFFLLIALVCGVCLALPDLRAALVSRMLGLLGSLDVTDGSGALSASALFSNNVRACVFSMLYGLLPFVQLPALALGMNALVLGVLAAQAMADGTLPLFLLATLPHGLFELPALILAFGMGLYVCGQLTRRCRHDAAARPFWDLLVAISWLLLLVLIPLLAAAALTETHITPLLLSLLQ